MSNYGPESISMDNIKGLLEIDEFIINIVQHKYFEHPKKTKHYSIL